MNETILTSNNPSVNSKNVVIAKIRNNFSTVDEQFSATYRLFASTDGVIEIRALLKEYASSPAWEGRGDTIYGYFDNEADFVKCAKSLDSNKLVKGIYVTMNPVASALLARGKNRLKAASSKHAPTTSDNDIVRRRIMLVDADPSRPAEISASQQEKEAALARRDQIARFLVNLGFPEPAEEDSGNGGHLSWQIDMPNDESSKRTIADFLEYLNWKFGDVPSDAAEAKRQFIQEKINVGIDTTVFNAARITKLYGSVTRKGDHTEERPHRRSQITYIPEQLEVVPTELIEALAQEWRDHKEAEEASKRQQNSVNQPARRTYNANTNKQPGNNWCESVDGVERWLADHGVMVGSRQSYTNDGFDYKWSVDCITSSEHKDGAVLMWGANKGFGYKCHHNSCKGKGWDDVRAIIDPNRPDRSTGNKRMQWIDAETGETVMEVDKTSGADQKDEKKVVSKATQIYELALEHCEIFTGTDGVVYAAANVNGHTENIKIGSMRFRQYLGNLFYQSKGSVAGKSACEEAIELLSFQGDATKSTFLRIAGHNDDIYIDLCNDKWQAVKVNATGWEIVDKPPVAFRRTPKMRPLPLPISGVNQDGAISDLFKLINVAEEDRTLVLAWLLSAMRPKGPYPILALFAEAGSAKTTTAKALKRLISPYVAETRSRPKTVEDVYIAAQNDWILIYDNLSSIPVDISNAFSCLSTGGGYATRELYANLDEVATDQQQPLIINGISDLIKKGDLMSRALVVSCPEISQERRIEESVWDKKFEEARPRIMGALLDLLSAVLEEIPSVQLDTLPRMADFARLGAAMDQAIGIIGKPVSFTNRYNESIAQGTMSVIEQSSAYRPLYKFMKHHGAQWVGTATGLLEEMRKHATDVERIDLPATHNKLSAAISEIAPNLRLANIMDVRKGKSNRHRSITIAQMKNFANGEPESGADRDDRGTIEGR